MRSIKLVYIFALYVTALGSFLAFASSFVTWSKYKFFSEEAVLFLLPDPPINSPDDERNLSKRNFEIGYPVRLTLKSGQQVESNAKLTSDQLVSARNEAGLPVMFRKKGSDTIEVIGSNQELEPPWMWLILWLIIWKVASFARKQYVRESESVA